MVSEPADPRADQLSAENRQWVDLPRNTRDGYDDCEHPEHADEGEVPTPAVATVYGTPLEQPARSCPAHAREAQTEWADHGEEVVVVWDASLD